MGNVSILNRFRRKLSKNTNGTISVSIPLEHAAELGWDGGMYVDVDLIGSKIVVKGSNRSRL